MPSWSAVVFWLEWLVRLVMLPVVVRRKSQPSVCLAWLTIIFLAPFLGLAAYLLFGEVRLGARRIRRHAREVDVVARADRPDIHSGHVVQPEIEKTQPVILHVADQLGGLPVLGGNSTELLTESDQVIDRLVQDIDRADHHVHLLFYIFAADEVGGRVAQAMVRARARGVRCRLLADAVGSRRFFRTAGAGTDPPGDRGRARPAGQSGAAALRPPRPAESPQVGRHRRPRRLHRIAEYREARLRQERGGPVARPDGPGGRPVGGPAPVGLPRGLGVRDRSVPRRSRYFPPPEARGAVALQVVPSGPNHPTRVLRDLAVEALHAARRHAAIITPYFVPDEALLVALRLAVVRGVRVDLIVPARSDQLLVGLAGQFFLDEVLQQGVHVHLYQQGLIHVKAMTVDEGFAMLGTANFDIRSFYLNFELNLLSYDEDLNGRLRSYQTTCIQRIEGARPGDWRSRGMSAAVGGGVRQVAQSAPVRIPGVSRPGIQTKPSGEVSAPELSPFRMGVRHDRRGKRDGRVMCHHRPRTHPDALAGPHATGHGGPDADRRLPRLAIQVLGDGSSAPVAVRTRQRKRVGPPRTHPSPPGVPIGCP